MGNYLTSITNYLWAQSWQVGVLAVIITIVSILLKNKTAHIRYLLWLILLVKCLVPPLLTVPFAILPQKQIAQPIIETAVKIPAVLVDTSQTTVYEPVTLPLALGESSIFDTFAAITTDQWLGLVWFLGMAIFVLIAGIKAIRLNHWLKRTRKPLTPDQHRSIRDLFAEINDDKFPMIWLIDGIGQPFVWGLLRGEIYLPGDFAEIKAKEHRRGILSHELSHVIRFDAAVNVLQIIAQAIFWFHPLVWWANKKIRAEREKCCDEMAIAWLGTKARDFSTAIVNILTAEHKSTHSIPSLAVAGPVKNIEDRIKTIMNPRKKFYKHPSILAIITILLLALIVVPTTLALTSPPPKNTNEQAKSSAKTGQKKTPDTNSVEAIDPNIKALGEAVHKRITTYSDEETFTIQDGQTVKMKVKENMTDIAEILITPQIGFRGTKFHLEGLDETGKAIKGAQRISSVIRDNVSSRIVLGRPFLVDGKQFFARIQLTPQRQEGNSVVVAVELLFAQLPARKEKYFGQKMVTYKLDESDDPNGQTEIKTGGAPRPQGNCSISGKVVSAKNGEPVGHARVYLFYLGTHAPIFINVASDGSFVFKNIPTGPFSLRTTGTAGYQDAIYNPEGKPGQHPRFSLKDSEQRSGIVLEVEPAYSISGRVLDENGELINDRTFSVLAWTELDESGGNLNRYKIAKQTAIAPDGSYLLDGLDDRPVYVMVIDWRSSKKDDFYPPCYYPGTVARNDAEKVHFDEEKSISSIDIHLKKKGKFALEGIVTNETTGKAISKALVTIHHRDMLFDHMTTYTNDQGHYRVESLGIGEFQVHVDAETWGFVRTRKPIKVEAATEINQLNFTLRRGAKISGEFVDENNNPIEMGSRAYGLAYRYGYSNPETMSWSGVTNKYGPQDRTGHNTFNGGEGDYEEEYMGFPTTSTFIVEGIIPGKTILRFHPKTEGLVVKEILYNGRNIMETGIETKPGQEIKGVTIVVGAP